MGKRRPPKGLNDKDKKALQKLLTAERKKLASALKDVDASLAVLKPKKKKAKKGKG
ncbi:hypothetical protein [Bradyrhizobium liaoningense]|uniref:hypothetical protein n=1 Tax=Bradyrhizobium liaoningense TaxID=43992 RepID=UPI001BAD90CD|nr:hypothetical protein [Bradyrhizobium liaoningense]MBR0716862.1 hypothetical protein [Bradyrhizobium liaoningense]